MAPLHRAARFGGPALPPPCHARLTHLTISAPCRDVSLGYGEPPARIHDEFWAGAVLLVLGFATLVLIIVNAGVHLRSRRARRGRSERAT